MNNKNIRNIAIIAHVDHGKTTLVDALLRQSHVFRDNEQVAERVMDSNDQEKERGITILAKNTAVMFNGVKINIVDTPGHADFGGEVERVLKTVDGVLLLVDAFEGAMPQTREVLKKSLAMNLKPIVVINKIDRPGAEPQKVLDEVMELFIELDANDDQLDFPVVYASAKNGVAKLNLDDPDGDLTCLFETIINTIQAPNCDVEGPAQMLVSNIDYDDYVGRIAVGRLERGTIKAGQSVSICKENGKVEQGKLAKLFTYQGLKRVEAEEIKAAFEKAGKRCYVAHYRRGMPRYKEAKRLIDSGVLGKVRGVQVIRTQRQTAEELLPEDKKPWRVRPEVSGGSHFYEGDAHMLDLIDYLAGPLTDFKLEVSNETHCYKDEDVVSLSGITANRVMVSGIWCYATYKAIDRFLIFGDNGSMEFSYYNNAAPLHIETLPDDPEARVAHEGVMGGVRKEPEMQHQDITPRVDEYPGLGNMQDIVNDLLGVPGCTCTSTLENAMRTLRITCTAHKQMEELNAKRAK